MLAPAHLVALVAVLAGSTAAAQPAPGREAGQAAFRVGAQAFRANRFAVAAAAFEQAYAADPRPETGFSIAQANRLQYFIDRLPWRVQRAVQLYQVYLERLPAGPRARDASEHLGELEPLLGELRRRGELVPYVAPVRTQVVIGAEVERATLTIDGEPAQLWEPVDVTAGSHLVVLDAPGYEQARRRVVIAAGRFLPVDIALRPRPASVRVRAEAGARLVVDGRDLGEAARAVGRVPAGEHVVSVIRRGRVPWSRSVALARDQALTLDVELAPTAQRRAAWWVLGGAAVVAAGSGGAAVWAYAARRDARALDAARRGLMATPEDLATYNRRVDQAAWRGDLAWGLGVAAGATAALGLGLWWFDRELPRAVSLQPMLGDGSRGLAIRGAL